MKDSIERLSLDIHNTSSGETVHAKRGYTAKTLIISLVDGGVPYIIQKDCTAVFTGKKPDGHVVINDCIIKDNTIIYSFTEQTVSVNGRMNCEIQLFGADGRLIISPKFSIIVSGPVYSDGDEIDSENEINTKFGKAVLFVPQDLTPEQQAQARKNIGAAAVGGGGGSLSAEIIDNILVINLPGNLTASIQNGVLTVA